MCHMSRVTCHVSYVLFSFFLRVCGASRWRVCYQRGLPRLVFIRLVIFQWVGVLGYDIGPILFMVTFRGVYLAPESHILSQLENQLIHSTQTWLIDKCIAIPLPWLLKAFPDSRNVIEQRLSGSRLAAAGVARKVRQRETCRRGLENWDGCQRMGAIWDSWIIYS